MESVTMKLYRLNYRFPNNRGNGRAYVTAGNAYTAIRNYEAAYPGVYVLTCVESDGPNTGIAYLY